MPRRLLILTAIAALIPLFAFAPSEAGAQVASAFMAIEKQNGILTAHEQGGPIASDLIVSNETAGSPGGVTRLEIRDGSGGAVSPLGSGTGCESQPSSVFCDLKGISSLDVDAGALNDKISVNVGGNNPVTLPVRLDGGGGSDDLGGGRSNDRLRGGPGADTLNGTFGDDTLDGGPGPDLLTGEFGTDTADYSNRPATGDGLVVTVGDDQPDGDSTDETGSISHLGSFTLPVALTVAGARDLVQGDVEVVQGGHAADDLVGDRGINKLVGNDGNDQIEGGGGADDLEGGAGNDLILARDGAADSVISCGPGVDRVVGDPQDPVGPDCEFFDRGGTAIPTAVLNPPPESVQGATGAGGGDNGQTAPQIQIVTRVARASRRGVVPLRIRCVYRAAECVGTVQLRARRRIAFSVGHRRFRIGRNASLGSASVSIPWGQSKPIGIRLSAAARRALGAVRGGLPAIAKVSARDSGAGTGAAVGTATAALKLIKH